MFASLTCAVAGSPLDPQSPGTGSHWANVTGMKEAEDAGSHDGLWRLIPAGLHRPRWQRLGWKPQGLSQTVRWCSGSWSPPGAEPRSVSGGQRSSWMRKGFPRSNWVTTASGWTTTRCHQPRRRSLCWTWCHFYCFWYLYNCTTCMFSNLISSKSDVWFYVSLNSFEQVQLVNEFKWEYNMFNYIYKSNILKLKNNPFFVLKQNL